MSQMTAAATNAATPAIVASIPNSFCARLASVAVRLAASARSTARSSISSAQANSSASMASPIGMTTSAGPGVMNMISPASVTVAPAMAKTTR